MRDKQEFQSHHIEEKASANASMTRTSQSVINEIKKETGVDTSAVINKMDSPILVERHGMKNGSQPDVKPSISCVQRPGIHDII